MIFFHRLERFFINLVLIILILLISVQLLMRNDSAYSKLKVMEVSIKNFFQDQAVMEGFRPGQLIVEEGVINIELLQTYSLPQVWLVKNGQRVANFAEGSVEIRVKEGDLLVLDCSFCPDPLWFKVGEISSNIKTWYTGQIFRIYREEKVLGVVQFYEKV